MPSVGDLDAKMREWSRDWKMPIGFPDGAGEGVFNDLWQTLDDYLRKNARPQLGLTVNFERVLGEMIALASWVTPAPFGNALSQAIGGGDLSTRFTWPESQGNYSHQILVFEQLAALLRKLPEHMRQHCMALDTENSAFQTYRGILTALRDEFEVGIYNLNYDDIALRAWPDAFTGFASGRFDPDTVLERREWGFVYHLHGSVHYSLADAQFRHSTIWKDDLSLEFEDSRALTPSMASNFTPLIPSTLVAGGYKLDQLLADPAQTLYSNLIRHAHLADAVLIAGYGFGDVHVNRALQNRFDRWHYEPERRPPAVVITKTQPDGERIGERQSDEFFSLELIRSLNARFPTLIENPSLARIPELIAQPQLEEDHWKRAAVWHGGFLEVAPLLDTAIAWLQR